ncbi:hypothetical protein L9W80_16950 [Vibrio aestuarianus]|uniref:hypothetical protein n=1 Tax=Vibrio aestuarianus TaxID=28171 RepID=UPI00237C8DDE|nr:hypothetical protein [Vibrio aestuarianus]MDE1351836.1 hypothetical protein [Vibrio aestuarianus]
MDNIEIIINGTTVFGWSDAVNTLLEDSVSGMALSLERLLPTEPLAVKELSERALNQLPMPKRTGMMPGTLTRIATLRAFKKRAEKQLLATSK